MNKYSKEIIILLIIILLGGFVRLYRIQDYMHFLGDEGRDVLVVKRMIVDHQLTLLGPITSVGSMYLGPIYYYMMAPFLWIFGMNPVGPAAMVALLSLATIVLIYILCLEFFDLRAAVISSLLYAFSPLVIVYSRFSWNPNAIPFFALLIIYGLLKFTQKKEKRWLWVIGLCLGVILQLHYLALIFIPIILIVLFINRLAKLKVILKIIISTFLSFSPFIAFEFRHNFPNIKTAFKFIIKGGDGATLGLEKVHYLIFDLVVRSFWRIVVIESSLITKLLIILLSIGTYLIYKHKTKEINRNALSILLIWFGTAMFLLGIYQGAIYDYYLVIIFPFPVLFTGIVLSGIYSKHKIFKYIVYIIVTVLIIFQLKNSPLLKEPNKLLFLTRERAKFIYNIIDNENFNFALITGSNSDHAYRYFLELWKRPPITIKNPEVDPQRKSVTDQLIVVCEIDCSPLGHPLWEIAGFGRAEIEDSWDVEGVTIYKLSHYTENI